jgi:hypothetical protein
VEFAKNVTEIKISRARSTGRWWSDVIVIGKNFFPRDRRDTILYEEKLAETGWRPGESFVENERDVTIWRKNETH